MCCQASIFSACAQSTEHISGNESTDQKETTDLNQLADAKSPYLQQHADNPVNWHEWGPEALGKAQREHKPLPFRC